MTRKIISAAVALLAAFVLQVGVAPYISIMGVAPNFFLVAVISIALLNGANAGAGVGFVAGLLLDLIGTGAVGPMALSLSVTGFVVGLLDQHLFAEGWLLPVTILGTASLVSEILYFLILIVLGSEVPFFRTLGTLVVPASLYTAVISLAFYPPISRFVGRERGPASFGRVG